MVVTFGRNLPVREIVTELARPAVMVNFVERVRMRVLAVPDVAGR